MMRGKFCRQLFQAEWSQPLQNLSLYIRLERFRLELPQFWTNLQ